MKSKRNLYIIFYLYGLLWITIMGAITYFVLSYLK